MRPAAAVAAFALVCAAPAAAIQDAAPEPAKASPVVDEQLVGHWSGALTRDGASAAIELTIRRAGEGGLEAVAVYPDWVFRFPQPAVPVTVDDDGRVRIEGLREGDATLTRDVARRQMIGPVGEEGATLHVKRTAPPPVSAAIFEPAIFATDAELAGELVLPQGDGPFPALVFLHGRGCSDRGFGVALGRLLADYGVAVLAYDKRGAGDSGGECATDFAHTVDDAAAAVAWARARPEIDADRVGVLGTSAGAWTAQAIAARGLDDADLDPPAFIVTWYGPATSIARQQYDSMAAFAETLGYDEARLAAINRVLDLTLDDGGDPAGAYAEMKAIEAQAEAEGWKEEVFVSDDFPPSADAMDQIWLRRHRFDPAPSLRRLSDTPYLAVFGTDDDVVPYAINAAALREALETAGNTRFEIVGAADMGHGIRRDAEMRELPGGVAYRHFGGLDPIYPETLVRFLREHGFASR
jgi:pimeloyl-ACP methyl ester carboxylesterase